MRKIAAVTAFLARWEKTTQETVVLLSREKADDYVRISVYTKDLQTKKN